MKYSIISNQKRATLLQRVITNKQPLKAIAFQLKIKFPSAKSIIRTYKKMGRIFNKKKSKKVILKQSEQNSSQGKKVIEKEESIKVYKKNQSLEKSKKNQTSQSQKQDKGAGEAINMQEIRWQGYDQPLFGYSMLISGQFYGQIHNWPYVYYQNSNWV